MYTIGILLEKDRATLVTTFSYYFKKEVLGFSEKVHHNSEGPLLLCVIYGLIVTS